MFNNLKFSKNEYILISIIGFLLILIIINTNINSDGSKCLESPLVYGVKQVHDNTGVELECGCNAVNTEKQYKPMFFNSTNVWFGNKYLGEINITS